MGLLGRIDRLLFGAPVEESPGYNALIQTIKDQIAWQNKMTEVLFELSALARSWQQRCSVLDGNMIATEYNVWRLKVLEVAKSNPVVAKQMGIH